MAGGPATRSQLAGDPEWISFPRGIGVGSGRLGAACEVLPSALRGRLLRALVPGELLFQFLRLLSWAPCWQRSPWLCGVAGTRRRGGIGTQVLICASLS